MTDQNELDALADWMENSTEAWDYIDEAGWFLLSDIPAHLRKGPTDIGEAAVEAMKAAKRLCEKDLAEDAAQEDVWV